MGVIAAREAVVGAGLMPETEALRSPLTHTKYRKAHTQYKSAGAKTAIAERITGTRDRDAAPALKAALPMGSD
jgi:hypothetical protein